MMDVEVRIAKATSDEVRHVHGRVPARQTRGGLERKTAGRFIGCTTGWPGIWHFSCSEYGWAPRCTSERF